MVSRDEWMRRVANLLGLHELPKDCAEKLQPHYEGGIRPPYAAALLRQWLNLDHPQ